MPMITGELSWHGAIVPLRVGVSRNRKARLEHLRMTVPQEVIVLAQIDTSSHVTALMPDALRSLQIRPFSTMRLRTPSTTRDNPHECFVYDVAITLQSGDTSWPVPSVHVIQCDDFNPDEEVQALIGRDILRHCVFTFSGPHNSFSLSF